MKLCEKGHYYDDARYSSCPYCGVALSHPPADNEVTVAKRRDTDITIAKGRSGDDAKTVGYAMRKYGNDPVVGWLVCATGEERGRDYRLHEGRNFIGRSSVSDICIKDDKALSRDRHAQLVYEPHKGMFAIAPAEGPVRLNGVTIKNAETLLDGDRIELGESEYIFVPFCKGERKWEKI